MLAESAGGDASIDLFRLSLCVEDGRSRGGVEGTLTSASTLSPSALAMVGCLFDMCDCGTSERLSDSI
jgi:hypothetical protein